MKKLIIFIVFNLISTYVNAGKEHTCFGRYKVSGSPTYIEVVVRSKEVDANKACAQISHDADVIKYAPDVNVMDKIQADVGYGSPYDGKKYFDCSIDKRLLPIDIIKAPEKFLVSTIISNDPNSKLDYCKDMIKKFGLNSGEFQLECNDKCKDFSGNIKRLGCILRGETCEKDTCLYASPNCFETKDKSCDLGYRPKFLDGAHKIVICVKSDTSENPTVFQTNSAR